MRPDEVGGSERELRLPERVVPHPASVSTQARAALAVGAARAPKTFPDRDDLPGWHAHIATVHARVEPIVDAILASADLVIERTRLADVDVVVAQRTGLAPDESARVNLHIHGGAWTYFGGRVLALPAAMSALHYGGVVYAVDYRTAPDHPFPAASDDCLAVYRAILAAHSPAKVLMSGDSAGGNLAAATLLRARDEGLPFPGALFLNTPVVDHTSASDSWAANLGLDVVLSEGLGPEYALYRGDADPRDPWLSPIYGDLTGFPPTYVRTGTRDLLLSDSVRMHAALRKAGVDADLYVGEAMPHGGFAMLGADTPEDVDAREDLKRWLRRHWR